MAKQSSGVAESVSDEMGMDAWLDHGGSGGGKFLGDWKDDGAIKVWLHPRSRVRVNWRHTWKEIAKNDKGDDEIRMTRFNSMERPAILEKQNFTNDDGSREYPPEVCPFSLLLDWVGEQIDAGRIGSLDPIFKFETDDKEEIIYAGGFTGLWQKKEDRGGPDEEEKKKIRKVTGIPIKEAYRQNCKAQEQTVFILIKNDKPGDGPIIATEGRGLSKAFKKEVKKRKVMFSKDPAKADPFTYPVCFLWEVDSDTASGFPEYTVTATDDDLTDEIKKAFEEDVPNTDKLFERSNVAVLQKSFTEHWIHEVVPPWKALFKKAFEVVKGTPASELPSDFKHGANAEAEEEDEEGEDDESNEDKGEGGETEGDDEPALCDECEGELEPEVFEQDPVVCPHCGTEYIYDEGKEEYVVKAKGAKKKEEAKSETKPDEAKSTARASRRNK